MTEAIFIRSFEASDAPAVVDLWRQVFPEDPPWNEPADVIDGKLTVQPELFFVCYVDARLAGTVLAGYDGVRGWIHKLAVAPELQGGGIASRLMAAAEEGLADLGCRKVNLQVRADNSAVVDFYSKAGYAVEERVSMGKRL